MRLTVRKSVTFGILIIFAGYAVASYGVVLLRGYNIPWSRWINPLNPWTWQEGTGGPIPPGQVFPGQGTLTSFAGTGSTSGPAQSKNTAVAATGAPAVSVGAAGGGFGR
jgi:hypothetical protein